MSQFGMQMPGSSLRAKPSPDMYTGLLLFAVVALAAASVFVFLQGSKIGADGSPWGAQDPDNVQLHQK